MVRENIRYAPCYFASFLYHLFTFAGLRCPQNATKTEKQLIRQSPIHTMLIAHCSKCAHVKFQFYIYL